MSSRLALVNVVRERVGSDSTVQALSRLTLARVETDYLSLTTFGTVLGRPSASFSPDLVPAPEYPETPNRVGGWDRSR